MKVIHVSLMLNDDSDDSLNTFGVKLINYLENGGFEASNVKIEQVTSKSRFAELTGKPISGETAKRGSA